MALTKQETKTVFDVSAIMAGDCIRAGRVSDEKELNGYVSKVDEFEITVTTCAAMAGVAYIVIPVEEVAAGLWKIRWTHDFTEIFSGGGAE